MFPALSSQGISIPRGAQHIPAGTVGSSHTHVMAGPPLPIARVWGTVPPAVPHGSALMFTFLLGRQNHRHLWAVSHLLPPGLSPYPLWSPLITSGNFLPGSAGSCSLAVPPSHQVPGTV